MFRICWSPLIDIGNSGPVLPASYCHLLSVLKEGGGGLVSKWVCKKLMPPIQEKNMKNPGVEKHQGKLEKLEKTTQPESQKRPHKSPYVAIGHCMSPNVTKTPHRSPKVEG